MMNTIIDVLVIFGLVSLFVLCVSIILYFIKYTLEKVFHIDVVKLLTSDDINQ